MNFKYILTLFGVMLFGAGIVLAISGATPTLVADQARWTGITATSDTTEGGNISALNISGSSLTDRWAAYFGNVSGSIVLRDTTNTVYTWAWAPSNGGEVCLSTNTAYPFTTAAAATTTHAQSLDSATFNLGSAADNATNTFTTANCNLAFNGPVTITNAANVTTTGGFNTCLVQDGAQAAKGDFAFCTAINSAGSSYLGQPAHYQVMVPTTPGAGTETYYFYMELN